MNDGLGVIEICWLWRLHRRVAVFPDRLLFKRTAGRLKSMLVEDPAQDGMSETRQGGGTNGRRRKLSYW
jgi:hypothetical protein